MLRLGFWRSDTSDWVGSDGAPLDPPGPGQALTRVDREGRPAAAIVHDVQLSEDPELLQAAGAAALLAHENAELDAAWKGSLHELADSRARLVRAGGRERRKLERDLHDGAQQRLVAASIDLSLAAELADANPELHDRVSAATAEVEETLAELREVAHEDDCVYLFLPLAHALALIVQFLVLDAGATLAYWEKDPQKIVANLMELGPTFFPSVPRIFEKIHALATSAGDARELEQATRVGLAVRHAQRRGEQIPAEPQAAFERAEQALYAKVRDLFGGRLRQAVTGAAPIAPGILEFFYACGVPVMEGYGMTETASVASVNTPDPSPRI